ncbi:hypothetical protein SB861_58070, partial [Paraburkholderia sp. SIMBA_049]
LGESQQSPIAAPLSGTRGPLAAHAAVEAPAAAVTPTANDTSRTVDAKDTAMAAGIVGHFQPQSAPPANTGVPVEAKQDARATPDAVKPVQQVAPGAPLPASSIAATPT